MKVQYYSVSALFQMAYAENIKTSSHSVAVRAAAETVKAFIELVKDSADDIEGEPRFE